MGMTQMEITAEMKTNAAETGYTEGGRVYAIDTITYDDYLIVAGDEGLLIGFTGRDGDDLHIEWDAGFEGTANCGDVAPLAEVDPGDGEECEGHESLNGADMGRTTYCDGSCT